MSVRGESWWGLVRSQILGRLGVCLPPLGFLCYLNGGTCLVQCRIGLSWGVVFLLVAHSCPCHILMCTTLQSNSKLLFVFC